MDLREERFLRRIEDSIDQFLIESKVQKVSRPKASFLSQEQLDSHYDNHYLGYLEGLKNAEKMLKTGKNIRQAQLDLAFNYNGAYLHEIYFDSLGSKSLPKDLLKTLNKSFESKSKMFNKLKEALMASRNGWAYIGFDKREEKFRVGMIDLHDCHVALWEPILAIDVWEHAFYIDFKSEKEKYVDGILEDINWDMVGTRVAKIIK